MLKFLAALAVRAEGLELFFAPENFVKYLRYMGTGMLVIFVVIGTIILATTVVNYLFSE